MLNLNHLIMDGLVRNISRTGRVISYTFYIVVTGASDGIGKAYAMQVRTVCVIPIPAVSLVIDSISMVSCGQIDFCVVAEMVNLVSIYILSSVRPMNLYYNYIFIINAFSWAF